MKRFIEHSTLINVINKVLSAVWNENWYNYNFLFFLLFFLFLLLLLLFFFFFFFFWGVKYYIWIYLLQGHPDMVLSSLNTNYAYFVKVYLYPQKYFDMWKGLNQHAVKIEKYSSNENDKIIHFKVKGLRGDYQNSDRNKIVTLIPSNNTSVVISHFLWMLVQWTSKLCPFHISENTFGDTLTHWLYETHTWRVVMHSQVSIQSAK